MHQDKNIHLTHIHTHTHSRSGSAIYPFSLHPFIAFIPLNSPYSLPPLLCSISPTLIALSVPLPSQSLPFIPSTSYRSDSIFISALLPLRSPVPRRPSPAALARGGPSRRDKMAPTAETQPPIYLEINHLPAGSPFASVLLLNLFCTPSCLKVRAWQGSREPERGPASVNNRGVTVISQSSDGPTVSHRRHKIRKPILRREDFCLLLAVTGKF